MLWTIILQPQLCEAHRIENAVLRDMVKMNKQKRGSSDVVTVSWNITAVRWKDNKVVNAVSTFTVKQPIQKVKRYCHRGKVESEY